MTPTSITPARAREILGLSRSRFDRLRHELRPFRYTERGRRVYDLGEVLAYRERHRVKVQAAPSKWFPAPTARTAMSAGV